MNAGAGQAGPPRARRRWPRWLLALCALPPALVALLWLVAWIALPPERVVPMLLARIGASLGLEISAEGDPSSRLGRRPTFVVRNLVAREPGAAKPLLQVRRVLVSLPWRTIRSLGDTLDLARVELDAPVLDLPALQHWLAARPPGEGRLPTLSDGLLLRDGEVHGAGWRVVALRLSLDRFDPARPLRARASGRGAAGALQVPFDLALSWTLPASGRGIAVAGFVEPHAGDWRMPAWITLSGAPHWDGALQLLPAKLGASARYVSGGTALPFALGLHGPLRAHGGAWTLLPAGIALRGGGMVPTLDARGRIAFGRRLLLDLDGRIAQWPADWPALPPPLGGSRQPLSLSVDYLGEPGFADPLTLRVARDDPVSSTGQALRFDGRLRVPRLLAWATATPQDSPLPPLSGRLQAPRIEISGAQLEGVVVEFGDEDTERDAP